MENLCDLLFEVSNKDRLQILLQLDEEAINVSGLSRGLGLTTQESSRHLARLGVVNLTRKDADGLHHITAYGRLVVRQLQGIWFTSRHKDYFASHTLDRIPQEFLSRLGELADCNHLDDTMVSLYNIEKMVREAEEHVWSINFPVPVSVFPRLREAFERGVKGRLIAPKDFIVHPIVKGGLKGEDRKAMERASATGLLEQRFIERMDLILWISEKEAALVSFPKPDGSFDLLGFASSNERTLTLARDLFLHYWGISE